MSHRLHAFIEGVELHFDLPRYGAEYVINAMAEKYGYLTTYEDEKNLMHIWQYDFDKKVVTCQTKHV